MGVDHLHAGLSADQQSAQVVPHAVGVDRAVHVTIETSVSHRAQIERCRAHGPKLTPAEVAGWKTRQPDNRFAQHRGVGPPDRLAVASGSPPPHSVVPGTGDQVDHDRGQWSVSIDRAEAGGEPGQSP